MMNCQKNKGIVRKKIIVNANKNFNKQTFVLNKYWWIKHSKPSFQINVGAQTKMVKEYHNTSV